MVERRYQAARSAADRTDCEEKDLYAEDKMPAAADKDSMKV